MPSRRLAVFALLFATALSRATGAQVRADPGTVINGHGAVLELTVATAERTAIVADAESVGPPTRGTRSLDDDGEPIVKDPARNPTTGGMALGAVGMVAFFGSWLYGIMDAADAADAVDAARRFNMVHGVATAGLELAVAPGAGGRTRVGVSIAVGR
jgi:hypothetical protein